MHRRLHPEALEGLQPVRLRGGGIDVAQATEWVTRCSPWLSKSRRLTPSPAPAHGDVGRFGPDSVVWRFHADPADARRRACARCWSRPSTPRWRAWTSTAVPQRSVGPAPRTTEFVFATTYGDTARPSGVRRVRAVHSHPRRRPGERSVVPGRDPDLLLWIHAVEVHSFVVAYRIRGSAGRRDADRYVTRWSGSPSSSSCRRHGAASMGELREYLGSMRPGSGHAAAREGMRASCIRRCRWRSVRCGCPGERRARDPAGVRTSDVRAAVVPGGDASRARRDVPAHSRC